MTVNLNGFYIDWKDQQVSVQLSGNVFNYATINAGSSRVYGGELETRFRPVKALDFYATAGYSNTRFNDFVVMASGGQNLAGQDFPDAPRWTVAAGGAWKSRAGWFVDLNANYRSSSLQQIAVEGVSRIPARTLVNAKLGWRSANYGAYLTATNLFEDRYFTYKYMNVREQAIFGEPRVIGVTLEGRFSRPAGLHPPGDEPVADAGFSMMGDAC